ncbi:MAG: hypothetical protein QOJ12_2704 [Thermoleophilales bacterium]|jgi:enoyl-CoA hydratase|nr:hypothetical protein [Thermoleophilales bacterium]
MAAPSLLTERLPDGVLLVTLNRPERLNAMTFGTFDELIEVCAEVRTDPDVRVVVLTGAGRGFCSGLDLDEAERLVSMTPYEMLTGQETWARGVTALRNLPKPVIAAVNGPAAGAGFGLALAADMRIASTTASFVAAFVRIGLTGGDVGVSWMLPRVVGMGLASEILMTGRAVDAEQAFRIGLVNAVVEPDALLDRARALAAEIAAHSPLGVRLTKQVLQTNVDAPSLEAALELENRNQVLSTRGSDMAEALGAFRERRAPRYTGR